MLDTNFLKTLNQITIVKNQKQLIFIQRKKTKK